MTIDEIKGAVCKFFNNSTAFTGCPFIKSPSNKPAPAGNYIAVGCDAVQQDGQKLVPGPGAGAFVYLQVATLYFFEVEGDGDKLRQVSNWLQHPDFISAAATAGFTVWEPSQILKVDTFDGKDYVRQWRMTVTVNFQDEIATETPTILTVDPSFKADGQSI